MTTTQTAANKTENKSAKKKQSFPRADIGTPKVPIRQHKTKQQQELLSDWNHAS
jgi:hypothetical protein